METCGAVADIDPVTGKLTLWSTTQAPHAHRTLYALVAGLPEHKIRVICPDIGGGFGNKVGIYPGYVLRHRRLDRHRQAGEVDGGPLREPDVARRFARDYLMHGEIAATSDGKILACGSNVLADHGAFNGTAQPTKYPAGFFHVFTGQLRPRGRVLQGDRRLHEQGARRRRVRLLVPRHRGGRTSSSGMVDCLADELTMDPAELRLKNLLRPEQFPYTSKTGWEYDSGDYAPRHAAGDGHGRLRRAAPRAGREAGSAAS